MLPTFPGDLVFDFELEEIPTRTFRIDFEDNGVSGFTDGREAMEQAIYLALHTERFVHEIYSWNYGAEIVRLFGAQPPLVFAKIRMAVSDALMQDDRILSVRDFSFEQNGKQIYAQFTAETIFGLVDAGLLVVI